jgi:outer membrane protein assembly factor BamB
MRTLLLICLTYVAICQPSYGQADFRFIQIGDAYARVDYAKEFATRANALSPQPTFVVSTGDIAVGNGAKAHLEFRDALTGLRVPFYAVPGDLDVRYSPNGKREFEAEFKNRYQSFDQNGCHFVLLDSTVLNQDRGHIDGAQLKWLEGDMKKVKKGTSIFVFVHHPIGSNPESIDNEDSVLRLIAPHRVIGIFSGHNSTSAHWKTNGIDCFSAGELRAGSFNVIDVTSETVTISTARKESGYAPEKVATVSRGKPEFRRAAFQWDDPNVNLLSRRRPLTELRIGEKGLANDDKVTAKYQVDRSAPKPMDRDKRDTKSVSFMTQFENKELGVGGHRLRLLLTDPSGDVYQRDEYFAFEELRGSPRRAWEYPVTEGVQGSAVAVDGTVYFGTIDGKVIALEAETGKRRWEFNAKDAVVATPVLNENLLFVGSMSGKLHCLDAKSGRERWFYDAGVAVSGSAAVLSGVVCIGTDNKLVGINVQNGKEAWAVPFPGSLGCNVTVGNGAFVAFRGSEIRVVDAATGTARWKRDDEPANDNINFGPPYPIATRSIASESGRIYFVRGGRLRAWDEKTGNDIWASPPPSGGERLIDGSLVVVADGKVIVCAAGDKGQGDSYAFSTTDGKLVWRCKTGTEGTEAKPALHGRYIVVSSQEGKLTWIDLTSGETKFTYRLDPGWCCAAAATMGDRAFIGSLSGSFICVSLPQTGTPMDKPRIPTRN